MKLQQTLFLLSPPPLLLLIVTGSKIKAELGRVDGRQPNPPTHFRHLKKINKSKTTTIIILLLLRYVDQTHRNADRRKSLSDSTRAHGTGKSRRELYKHGGGGGKTFRVHHAGPDWACCRDVGSTAVVFANNGVRRRRWRRRWPWRLLGRPDDPTVSDRRRQTTFTAATTQYCILHR